MNRKNRLEKVFEYLKSTGVTHTKKGFAAAIGGNYTNVTSAFKGNDLYLTSGFFDKIEAAFPQINAAWLLAGAGQMLKSDLAVEMGSAQTSAKAHIRYWVDIDATAGGVQLFDDSTTNNYIDLSIPEFRDCTDAVNLYGDSMLPTYKSGQIIILKRWVERFIDFGNVYLIVTKSGNRMVKYIRKGSDSTHVLCASENKDFDPFEIEKEDILHLYLVKGGISKNTL